MIETCPPTIGALLAGGLARRMGGGDKPLRHVGGRPILDHVVERMAPQCAGLVINANGDPARFAPYGLPVVPDDVPGFAGPLAGILAVLDHVAVRRRDVEWIVSVAADTPFLPPDLVARLHAARQEEGAMLACAASGGRTHPVVGLWPVGIREDLRRALVGEGERKIDRFTARFPLAVAEWPTEPFDVFFNANAPADLEAAEAILVHARLS
ncbi:molybdenum cofactor guanylyltransferase, proteobacterial [Chelatococcus sambhunathii]|uniref:Molybdenum cofactor guanylyltransferase n=2 Tax=Chelatococcus TaxID=28209 RepID=A0AAC9JPB3_9HYPH|nr:MULTISPECIES: molybdenum cofactor guanylyltransferase MobA [Chelatococcus]APF37154.1 molybdenum cofactor guanylyltransferase MobA [Chelatococcus daeguensis]CUA89359.1 molybdenum cofactor guanylyltransferase, proteobacterial [Chelatococcus sambhunathii]